MTKSAMTIRVSQTMSEKLGLKVTAVAEVASNPLCDWAVHLFRSQRRQYILVVNTTSLFPVVLEGKGLKSEKTFLGALFPALREQHCVFGLERVFDRYLAQDGGSAPSVAWSKVGLRQVTGSMNEQIHHAKAIIEDAVWEGREFNTQHLSMELSENMLSMIAYHRPFEAHRQMIESLTE